MNKNILIFVAIVTLLTGCAGIKPDLGIQNGKLSNCPTTANCVSSMAKDKKYYIEPIITKASQTDIKNHILSILNGFNNAKIVTIEDNYIRAEFRSQFFKFVDDVEFYFPESFSEEMIIHFRSASRVGSSDFGVNRKRMEQIRSRYSEISLSI